MNEFVTRNGLISLDNSQITGSLNVSGGITGSLFGTSSWALNALTASNSTTASFVQNAVSASFATNALTASHALTASSADSFLVRQNITASNLLVSNTITAQTLVVQTVTSSISFITGSTKFGSLLSNTHQFTGSVTITGSLSVNDSPVVTNTVYTPFSSSVSTRVTNLESTASVLTTASASFALVSSSYSAASGSLSTRVTNLESTASVLTTASASFAAVSASYSAMSGSTSTRLTNLETASGSFSTRVTNLENASASFASQSGSNSIRLTNLESTASVLTTASASFALVSSSYSSASGSISTRLTTIEGKYLTTGSNVMSGSQVITGSLTITGSINVSQGITGSLFGTASWAQNVVSASFATTALTASHALTASSINRLNQDVTITGSLTVAPSGNRELQVTSTGVNIGNTITDTHIITGSIRLSGSMEIGPTLSSTSAQLLVTGTPTRTKGIIISSSWDYQTSWAMWNGIFASEFNLGGATKNVSEGGPGSFQISLYNATTLAFRYPITAYANGNVVLGGSSATVPADTGESLQVAGSGRITNGLTVTGSLVAPTITGSLFGTASWARNVITASFAQNTVSASRAVSSSYPVDVINTTLYSVQPRVGTDFNQTHSIFFGESAGSNANLASYSNYLGYQAGTSASSAAFSNFLGSQAGYLASVASTSNFLGYQAGYLATNANRSNFLGEQAGAEATSAAESNFLGYQAGYQATSADLSIFIGSEAGLGATNARQSVYMGEFAGKFAINSQYSIFIGNSSGLNATNAVESVYLGTLAGNGASSASYSTFIGSSAGGFAINATYSNFLGSGAGSSATSASYSNLIGYRAGSSSGLGVTSIGSNNIIIGTNVTLSGSVKDSINIGGLIFGSGSYSTTTGNPFSGSANGRIGVNQPLPQFNFDVSGSSRITNGLTVTGSLIAPTITGSLQGTASWAVNVVNSGTTTAVTYNRVTASYTLALSDAGKTIEVSGSTPATYNITVPAASTTNFNDGTYIDVILYGTGSIQFVTASGVTFRSANNWTKLGTRYGAATLLNITGDEWYIVGNLNA